MNSKELGRNLGKQISAQNKLLLQTLGVDIEITPEDTGTMSIMADLPPIADGVEWRAGLNLADGTIVIHSGKNYLVLQSHISLAGWEPDSTPALFKEIKKDYVEWEQPGGSYNAYMKGDKVSYNGKIYESLIDGNVWSPDAHPAGWKEIG